MLNPFGTTFESFEGPFGPVVESIHQAAYQQLLYLIESGEGHLISLRSPRAGYGKSMLLSRLRDKTKGRLTMVPIQLGDGQRVEVEGTLAKLLTQLIENVPTMGGLTRLDLCIRRLFSKGLLPMVYSGEVPCQDKDGAVASLRERPIESLDFHHSEAAIAQWCQEQFHVLSPRLSSVLSSASGVSSRDASYWIDLFFKFSTCSLPDASRVDDLMAAIFGRESRFRSGVGFLEGLSSFLNLVTLVEPVVFVLDEVDGISSETDAALRAATSLVSLWEASRRVSVVVSINDDVWNSAFAPRLPAGLRDRLEDVVIRLNSLTLAEASSLISARAGGRASWVIDQLDLSLGDLYPRGVLRAAREVWDRGNVPREGDDVAGSEASQLLPLESGGESFVDSRSFPGQVVVHEFRGGAPSVPSAASDPPIARPSPADEFFFSPLSGEAGQSQSSPFSTFAEPPSAMMPGERVENLQGLPEAGGVREGDPAQLPMQSSPFGMDSLSSLTPSQKPDERGAALDQIAAFQDSKIGQESTNSPPESASFNPGIAIEALKGESYRNQNPFSEVPEFGIILPKPSDFPQDGRQASPFEIVKQAPSQGPGGAAVPKAEGDAIEELLQQFRDSRDS